MKIIFFGTPTFSAEILKYLIQRKAEIIAIVTQPDRARGRSQKVVFSPVKQVASELLLNILVFQPVKAKDPVFIEQLRRLRPDLFVVVGYGQILSEELLNVPVIGSINIHASLLPSYRGAAPIQRCIMNDEKETGITIMQIEKDLDAGEMLAVKKVVISENMTFEELHNELLTISKPLLWKVVSQISSERAIKGERQDERLSSYAKKLDSQEFQCIWNFPNIVIHNQIRALSPKPGAWCWMHLAGEKKRLKILRSKISSLEGTPGELLESDEHLIIGCRLGSVELLEVQLEGKKVLKAKDFLRGINGQFFF